MSALANYWTTYRRMKTEYPDLRAWDIRSLTKYDILTKKDKLNRSQWFVLRYLTPIVLPLIEAHRNRTEITVEPTITVVEPANELPTSTTTNEPQPHNITVVVPHKKYTKKEVIVVEPIVLPHKSLVVRHEAPTITHEVPNVAHLEVPSLIPRDISIVVPKVSFLVEDAPSRSVFETTRINIRNDRDYNLTFESIRPIIRNILSKYVIKHAIKVTFLYRAVFLINGNIPQEDAYLYSSKFADAIIILSENDLDDKIEEIIRGLYEHVDLYTEKGSDVVFKNSVYLDLMVAEYKPLGAGHIPLPDKIKKTESCINPDNDDEYCALHALYMALYPENDHASRVSKYKKYWDDPDKKINYDGIEFPMDVGSFGKLERQNPKFAVFVFKLGETKEYTKPLYISENFKKDHTLPIVDLGLIEEEDEDEDEDETKDEEIEVKDKDEVGVKDDIVGDVKDKGKEIKKSHYECIRNLSR